MLILPSNKKQNISALRASSVRNNDALWLLVKQVPDHEPKSLLARSRCRQRARRFGPGRTTISDKAERERDQDKERQEDKKKHTAEAHREAKAFFFGHTASITLDYQG